MSLKGVFLGINEAGEEIYDWLNQDEDIEIKALLTEKEQLDLIKDLSPDIVVSVGFEHKVPEEIINVPRRGIINIHPSYLPHHRGAHPYVWPIIDSGPAGVSIHYMSEEIDEGPIIAKTKVEVRSEDTAKTLYDRLTKEQIRLFKQEWPNIKKNKVTKRPQSKEEGNKNYIKDFDRICRLDLDEKVRVGDFIDRLRGLSFPPHDTVYFEKDGERYYVELSIKSENKV